MKPSFQGRLFYVHYIFVMPASGSIIEMARSAICKYLDAKFSSDTLSLQEEVGAINNLVVLDKIIGKIYTANTMEEAATIVKESTLY